jgi:uncharacterized RDD family membrane protein YckC
MENISVQTSQNVRLDFETAGMGDRILALLVDWGVYTVWMLIILLVAYVLDLSNAISETGFVLLYVGAYLPVLFYPLYMEIFNNGQTIGKMVRKIKVIRMDGGHPGTGDFFIRWAFRILEVLGFIPGLAILVLMINGKGQRLGDITAGTTVAKVGSNISLTDTILTHVYADDYIPEFPQIQKLRNSDIELLKSIDRIKGQGRRAELYFTAATRIHQLCSLEWPTGRNPERFVQKVIEEYNWYQSRETSA